MKSWSSMPPLDVMVTYIPKLMASLGNYPLTMMIYITGSPENSISPIIMNFHFLAEYFLCPTLFFIPNDNSHNVYTHHFSFHWSVSTKLNTACTYIRSENLLIYLTTKGILFGADITTPIHPNLMINFYSQSIINQCIYCIIIHIWKFSISHPILYVDFALLTSLTHYLILIPFQNWSLIYFANGCGGIGNIPLLPFLWVILYLSTFN